MLFATTMFFRLDAVKYRVAEFVSEKLNDGLGLPLQLGAVAFDFPNAISIDSLLVLDMNGDTALSIPRVSANFDVVPFLKDGALRIHNVSLCEPDVRLSREAPDSSLNIQFILDKFASSDTTSTTAVPDLRVNQLQLYDGRVSYDVHSAEHTVAFNAEHILVENLQANISLRALDSDTLSLYVRKVSFAEQSGFEVKRLAAKVDASRSGAHISRLKFTMPNSRLVSKGISLRFDSVADNIYYEGSIESSGFSPQDFVALLPRLCYSENSYKFNVAFEGEKEAVDINRLNVSTADKQLNLNANLSLSDISKPTPVYSAKIKSLSVTPDVLSEIYAVATDGDALPQEVARLGNVALTAEASGVGMALSGVVDLVSESGAVAATVDVDKDGRYTAVLNADNVDVGTILGDSEWGYCGLNSTVEGTVKDSTTYDGAFTATLSPLQYKGYSYAPIQLDGDFTNNRIKSLVALCDSNLCAKLSAEYVTDGNLPRCELTMNVDSFRPHNLGLTDDYESACFSFNVKSDIFGDNIEMGRLNLHIYDFLLSTPKEDNRIRKFHLSAGTFDGEKSFIVDSDFMNGYLKGYYSYATLLGSFKQALARVAPSLFERGSIAHCNNNFVFHFNITNTAAVSKIFNLPVVIKELSMLQGSCNDAYDLLTLAGNFKNVECGSREYSYIDFLSTTDGATNSNKLKMVRKPERTESEDYYPDNDITVDFQADVRNDSVFTNVKWANIYTPVNNADIKVDVALGRDVAGKLDFKALMHKGFITQNDTLWRIMPSTVYGSDDAINIDNFILQSNNQYLHVDGRVGKKASDVLNVDLRNVNMEYIFDLIDFHPVNLGGDATGTIRASALLDSLRFNSNLHVKGLTFERGLIGDLDFNGYWDDEQRGIVLKGDAREGDVSRTIVNGLVSPERDTLNICVDAHNTRIEFLNHLLSSFIGDASGRTSGKLYILGAMRDVNLQGAMAPLGSLRIKPINAQYTLTGDTVYFTRNKIGFDNFHVKDHRGNSGSVTGGVYHQSLKNFTCSFHIDANNLLAFNFPDFGEESFYGTAYVTGDANFSAGPSGLKLNANVTTGPGSKFVYNASTPEGNISDEFVTFVDRKKKNSLIYDLQHYHMTEPLKRLNSELNLDFMIDVTPDMQLRVYTNQATNDYIDVYGSGKVNAIFDEIAGFTMQGSLGLTRGVYKFTMQDIFPKEFDIRSGSSVAFNGDPFEADINLKTVYTLPSVPLTDLSLNAERRKNVKVNCFMDITGTIFKPNLAFDIELPDGNEEEKELLLSAISTPEQLNMQFIYLLGIGKFYTYDYNNQKTESQSSTAMESLISNTISGQLNNMLSQIIDNGNWNISGNFTTSEKGWNSMEVEGMLSGRLLDNRLLVNGNLGYRDNPIANKNFIGDFEVQWLLNKSGNVSLKAYNKTNDRYFSKTTLTTQGAGILLKRDFDGWKFWKRQF